MRLHLPTYKYIHTDMHAYVCMYIENIDILHVLLMYSCECSNVLHAAKSLMTFHSLKSEKQKQNKQNIIITQRQTPVLKSQKRQ